MSGARAVAAAVVVGLAAAPGAAQDWAPGRQFAESARRAFAGADRVAEKTPLGLADGVCFLAARLIKGEDVRFLFRFDAGVRYAVVAAGDDGAKDLDLVVTDAAGTDVTDALQDNRPVVEFTPPKAGQYTLKLVMHDAGAAGGFGSVVILKAGGHRATARDKDAAVTNLAEECGNAARRDKRRVEFSTGPNRWAVWGGVLTPGGEESVNLVPPGGRAWVWLTRGDTAAEVIYSNVSAAGRGQLDKYVTDDARPRLTIPAEAGGVYTVGVRNIRSRGPSLILTAALAAD